MTKFVNGPAVDVVLLLKRAPLFLRAVEDLTGKWDALDQLTDVARVDERIVVYRRSGPVMTAHVNMGRKGCGWFMGAEYAVVEPQPDQAVLQNNTAYREWAIANTIAAVAETGVPA